MTETPEPNKPAAEVPAETSSPAPAAASGRDRLVKIGFVVLLIAAVIAVYSMQTRKLDIPGWGDDLTAALDQARAENRMVVALFANKPPSATARDIRDRVRQPANINAVKQGKFIPVVVTTSAGSSLATKYKVKTFPTLIVFLPDGSERNRAEGNVGEVPFRQKFLENPAE
jgi:hypothetical protein